MPQTFTIDFTLGGEIAEHDPYLLDAYIDNGAYEAIRSRTDSRCFIIGRTGSGKSACLLRLEHDHPAKVIRIAPENLAMTYITNLDIIPRLIELGVQLDPFLKALWKHVFMVEILRHRFTISTPEQKFNVINYLRDRFRKDPGKVAAVEYLSEFGDRFWCETDERVQQIAHTFQEKVVGTLGVGAPVGLMTAGASGTVEQMSAHETRTELTSRYQRIVNEVQIPRLNKMMDILNTEILDDQHYTYIVIDDLDKNWVDDQFANLLIRCLFLAIMDMQRIKNLKFLVALRTNIFEQIGRGSNRRGDQEEKLISLALNMEWTVNSLRRLLARRVQVASQSLNLDPQLSLDDILPKTNRSVVNPVSYIVSRTLMRPRDAILFVNECLKQVTGSDSMKMDDIYKAEKRYSEQRLRALSFEWQDPYTGIDMVLAQFHGCPVRPSGGALADTLDNVAVLIGDKSFQGSSWLEPLCEFIWAPGSRQRSWMENYGSLADLLYRIGFLGVVKGKAAIYSYEERSFLIALGSAADAPQFEIHPAFQQALRTNQGDAMNL